MPTELELDEAWDQLQRALDRLATDPSPSSRALLGEAKRRLSALWRADREALSAFSQGEEIHIVFGSDRLVDR